MISEFDKFLQSLEILYGVSFTMIRASVWYVLILNLVFCSAQEQICRAPCTCDRSTGWAGLAFITSIPNVQVLDCFDQNLKEFPNPIHDSIGILMIYKNNISKLEITGWPKRLEVLNVNENQVDHVGKFEAKEIRFLHLYKNKFKRVPWTSTSIEYLDLDENQIDADPDRILLLYTNLKRLDMKDNKLEILPEMPSTIIEVNLMSNKIKFINDYILSKLPNLKRLFLSNNNIYKIYLPEAFYLSKLELLDIENNPIEMDSAIKEWCKGEKLTNDFCKNAQNTSVVSNTSK